MKIGKRKITWLIFLLAGLFLFTSQAYAVVPVPSHPNDTSTVYLTIPYFEWNDVVAHPYPGQYEIQIDDNSNFSSIFDEDTIPAFLSWYSPTVEFTQGTTYYWRVRYIDTGGTPDSWSSTYSFDIGFPYVVDVLTTDGWDEIQAKLAIVAAYGNANAQAGELRFPVGHTFNLVQDPADEMLFDARSTSNWIINGRGSKLVLEKTTTLPSHKCGILYLRQNYNIQWKDMIIDYHPNSLGHFGGVISNLDIPNQSFTVTVDTNVYQNFSEAADVYSGFFLGAENSQSMGCKGSGWDMANTWAQGQQSASVFNFTAANRWSRIEDELENGDYFISAPIDGSGTQSRGGTILNIYANAADVVVNNITTLACRGLWWGTGSPTSDHVRIINNQNLRTQNRLLGSASGGTNQHGHHGWWEGNTFEYSRDDMYHCGSGDSDPIGPGQQVIRNNSFTGGARGGIWAQTDRIWIANNLVMYNRIVLGKTGQGENPYSNQIDVGLMEDNQIVEPIEWGFESNLSGKQSSGPGHG